MTLIVTQISKYGIIHACDTNVTNTHLTPYGKEVKNIEEHSKLFKIPHLNAALTVAGSYCVGGILMDKWMMAFIQKQSTDGKQTLEQFARNLGNAFQNQMSAEEKTGGSLVHIAGYVQQDQLPHPELWFVRNVGGISNDGLYYDMRNEFEVSEDFWKRDYSKNNLDALLEQGGYQIYINGFPPGRIIYVNLQSELTGFFRKIWHNPAWQFRPPQTLNEMEAFVKLYVQFITTFFQSSNYEVPFIGGKIETFYIPNPLSS